MPYEIELKARIDDWRGVEARVRTLCTWVREFRKEDRYFRRSESSEVETAFRLRLDGPSAVGNFKEKRERDGVEYNREREFHVDDADAFLELIGRIGCEQYAAKVKTGLEFRHGRITVELVHVDDLGDFLELEVLEPAPDYEAHARAAAEIRTLLERVGISVASIEPGSYVDLLRRKKIGQDDAGA